MQRFSYPSHNCCILNIVSLFPTEILHLAYRTGDVATAPASLVVYFLNVKGNERQRVKFGSLSSGPQLGQRLVAILNSGQSRDKLHNNIGHVPAPPKRATRLTKILPNTRPWLRMSLRGGDNNSSTPSTLAALTDSGHQDTGPENTASAEAPSYDGPDVTPVAGGRRRLRRATRIQRPSQSKRSAHQPRQDLQSVIFRQRSLGCS